MHTSEGLSGKECITQGKSFKTGIMGVLVIIRHVDGRMAGCLEDFKEGSCHCLKENLSWAYNVDAILKTV